MATSSLKYEQQPPRINKPDMFMNTALMMERSPQAESPYSFVLVPELTKPEVQGDDLQKPDTGEAVGSEVVQEVQEDDGQSIYKDASARNEPVVQVTSEEKETSEVQEGQSSGNDVSARQQKPVRQESAQRAAHEIEPRKCNKSGAVVVLPNDRALSVDCSQEGVHAAVSALNKFGQERAKGCQVYLSRRPCSYCAKLLVQCELAKVYYLPIEPELNDKEDVQRVDKLFKASSAGLSVFIPKVTKNVIDGVIDRTSPFNDQDRDEEAIKECKKQLIEEYWSDEWIRRARHDLEWPAFDKNMQEQTQKDMYNLMEWIARATVGDVPERTFVEIDPYTLEGVPFKKATQTGDKLLPTAYSESIPSIPTPNEPSWQRHALHMVRMAQMLSQRSDDPSNPVGCILMVHGEVVAIGWNGFPAKALYGEFPRASSTDQGASRDKKEPYVIHAEQNALLTRNKRNMNHKSSILYSNKVPCGECVPLLIQAGVKNVVVPCEPLEEDPHNKAFLAALKKGKLKGYWPSRDSEEQRNDDVERVRRQISPMESI